MNVSLSEYHCSSLGLKYAAPRKPWRQALALPEDAKTYALEITKFLATLALIAATGVLLLLLG